MKVGVRRDLVLLTLLALCLGASCQAKQFAVIVDKTNKVGGMSSTDLLKVFKFDSRRWPDGKSVVVVMRDPSTPEMRTTIQKLYRMQPQEFKTLLSSHHSGVVIVQSEEELLKSVESIPGAVGIIDVYSITSRVHVLKVDGKLPLEPGYFLKAD